MLQTTIEAIDNERRDQDRQWGGPGHDDTHVPEEWLAYIARQMSFAKTQVVHCGGPQSRDAVVRMRLAKIAALAVAAIESIDRRAAQGQPDTGRGE